MERARFLGIDVGAEALKIVALERDEAGQLEWTRRALIEHQKRPVEALTEALEGWGWGEVSGVALSGRLARAFRLPRIPEKQARAAGFRHLFDAAPATLVSIGSHGFSALELRGPDREVFRENPRCSQGTGNFLRQLVERFGLGVEEASLLCRDVEDPAPLSGRCPVILKTDMTHLANLGQSHERILAGLYDAVAENVQVLLKPSLAPPRLFLLGGVTRAERIRAHFQRFADQHGMTLTPIEEDQALFLDAVGCALYAARAEERAPLPELGAIAAVESHDHLEALPGLKEALSNVKRLTAPEPPKPEERPDARLVLGLDIGSTGSKMVAIDEADSTLLWRAYTSTSGAPVDAAQRLIQQLTESSWRDHQVVTASVTGSGREIVGSLLLTCYGAARVFVLNEIAAHAEGALNYDPRVDTIFEIGGQDAKYIRLAEGRVVDAAMNEACSAGTGSFIEEQGLRFSEVEDVVQMGQIALEAESGVSLGQHCSVFMAEIIDEAAAGGAPQATIIAGIYDAIIQNYLNRVKGSRSVGEVIFCQGMPFASDALAAAVAKRTGSEVIIPPDPGTIGALGIARLARRERPAEAEAERLDMARFLSASVASKDHFICPSNKGCGGSGAKCRIERLRTVVEGEQQRFTWGGACSLYDKGTGRRKLPDGAPDPFRAREALIESIIADLPARPEGPIVATSDEFVLKGLFPFFTTYLNHLGARLEILRGANQRTLKRGIEEANVPFCAPMQMYHGVLSELVDREIDYLFLPMLLSAPPLKGESRAVLCPIVQGSADLNRWDLKGRLDARQILSPVFEIHSEGLRSRAFVEGCKTLAESLGVAEAQWHSAFERALRVQEEFDATSERLGQEAMAFCEAEEITPVVVLGRPYTIYNNVLNSNVPTILREQGAIAIPVDCYPVDEDAPVIEDLFWGHGQRNLRAVHQIRRQPNTYSVWASNYACGPDSFNLHLFSFLMDGKPWSVIETDGHSGDAGTRTRIEAFLHCVKEDQRARAEREAAPEEALASIADLASDDVKLEDIAARKERVLIPRMGPAAESLAGILRGAGIDALALPEPDHASLDLGRRYTSGKECVPMTITLGSLLQLLDSRKGTGERFVYLMPKGRGPCRFGVYHFLHKMVLDRLGYKDQVRVWAPSDNGYFEGIPAGISALTFAGLMTADVLLEAYNDVRPVEREPGATQEIYDRYSAELVQLMEAAGGGDLSIGYALSQTGRGRFFGCGDLLKRAAAEFAAQKRDVEIPTAILVGEIYVRCDPFSNDFVIDRLVDRGIRVKLSPFHEWLDYQEFINTQVGIEHDVASWFSAKVQAFIQVRTYDIMGKALGWPPAPRAKEAVETAEPYIRYWLEGEASLTLGGGLHEWREGRADGVLSIAPLECMPSKLAESQFFHAAEEEGVYSMTLALNGDPIDPETLDNFAFELKARFKSRRPQAKIARGALKAMGRAMAELKQGMPTPAPLKRRVGLKGPLPGALGRLLTPAPGAKEEVSG